MWRKSFIPLLIGGLVLFSVWAYTWQTVSFEEMWTATSSEIAKLSMLDGRTGEIHATQDEGKIEEFLGLMKSVSFQKEANQEARTGYLYSVDFYGGDGGDTRIFRIAFAGGVEVDGVYYNVNRNLDAELQEFYDSLLEDD